MLRKLAFYPLLLAVVFLVVALYTASADLAHMQGNRVGEGIPYVMGTASNTHGPVFWAISDGGDFNTGTEVCEFEGYTCKAVIAYSNGMIASKINCNVETGTGKIGLVACK